MKLVKVYQKKKESATDLTSSVLMKEKDKNDQNP